MQWVRGAFSGVTAKCGSLMASNQLRLPSICANTNRFNSTPMMCISVST
jgi:hypothetical protein